MKLYIILTLMFGLMGCGKEIDKTVAGPQGIPGSNGLDGAKGNPGSSCTESPMAATGVLGDPLEYGGAVLTCMNGSTLITNGSAGTQGQAGVQGAAGTSISLLQFCPGIMPSYPNTFPEVGVCLGGQLFGVYSANDGFLSVLPPGNYSSDGINASCTFTVGANCAVSR